MIKFIRSLGKKVQELLKKIFSKKNRKSQNAILGPGEIYINGCSFGKVDNISIMSSEEILPFSGDGDFIASPQNFSLEVENPKNFFNIIYPNLPKRYWCKTLLISLAANQESDYIAVDMSQYEERKLAHYICGRKIEWEELLDEYEFTKGEREFFQEEIERAKKFGVYSATVADATLLHYEDLGLWEIEE